MVIVYVRNYEHFTEDVNYLPFVLCKSHDPRYIVCIL